MIVLFKNEIYAIKIQYTYIFEFFFVCVKYCSRKKNHSIPKKSKFGFWIQSKNAVLSSRKEIMAKRKKFFGYLIEKDRLTYKCIKSVDVHNTSTLL